MTAQPYPAGPAELVDGLTRWAAETSWVEWLELAGSLGRGAGDALSDIDAGLGVTEDVSEVLEQVHDAVTELAPPAAVLRQRFGAEATHFVVVYRDRRQLSLVVSAATSRPGLPPEATALVDKTGRLASSIDPSRWNPDSETRREWTFLACIAAGDALKHSARSHLWRAVGSLNEARDHYLKLLAAAEQVIFPQFGAVSLENADRMVPDALAGTLVGTLDPDAIAHSVRALIVLLEPYIAEHDLDQLVVAIRPPLRANS